MRFDKYTKAVLTVIAICLVWLCARDITAVPAQAVPTLPRQEVIIAGFKTAEGVLPITPATVSSLESIPSKNQIGTTANQALTETKTPATVPSVNSKALPIPVGIETSRQKRSNHYLAAKKLSVRTTE